MKTKNFSTFLLFFALPLVAKTSLTIGVKQNPNAFNLPQTQVTGEDVTNILDDQVFLDLGVKYEKKLKKIGGLQAKYKFNLSSTVLTNTDGFDLFVTTNKDGVSKQLKDFNINNELLLFKKLAKKTAFFLSGSFKYAGGYSVDYHLIENSYYLLDQKHMKLSLGTGVQSKLSKKWRFDSFYSVSMYDYMKDYSLYAANENQQEDRLAHNLSLNFSYKLAKGLKLNLKNSGYYKVYKSRLALQKLGGVITQGTANQDILLGGASGLELEFKRKKKIKLAVSYTKSFENDQVTSARDKEVDLYKLSSTFYVGKKLEFDTTVSYQNEKFENMASDFINPVSQGEKLSSQSSRYGLGVKYKLKKIDLKLNYLKHKIDSNRDYDYRDYDLIGLNTQLKF